MECNRLHVHYLSKCDIVSIYNKIKYTDLPKIKELTIYLNSWELAKNRRGTTTLTNLDDNFQIRMFTVLKLLSSADVHTVRSESLPSKNKKDFLAKGQKKNCWIFYEIVFN